jgi:hypothetical protein
MGQFKETKKETKEGNQDRTVLTKDSTSIPKRRFRDELLERIPPSREKSELHIDTGEVTPVR